MLLSLPPPPCRHYDAADAARHADADATLLYAILFRFRYAGCRLLLIAARVVRRRRHFELTYSTCRAAPPEARASRLPGGGS
jgi:hypothetical protein